MAYSFQTGDRKGCLILSNHRAIVLHQGEKCRWAEGFKGWLIRKVNTFLIKAKRKPAISNVLCSVPSAEIHREVCGMSSVNLKCCFVWVWAQGQRQSFVRKSLTNPVGGWVSPVLFPPLGVSPCGCVGAGPPSGSLSRLALAFMGYYTLRLLPAVHQMTGPSRVARAAHKARGSTRVDAPADSALRHGSKDTTDHVPELGAQTAVPPGNDEFTALAEQLAIVKAESDAMQAYSYAQFTNLAAETKQMRFMMELIVSQLPACGPTTCRRRRPRRHQRQPSGDANAAPAGYRARQAAL